MRYLSVCSGIEAASCAWHPLGWRPVAFSEIGAFPSAVLAERWPEVPNLGDMTQFEHWPARCVVGAPLISPLLLCGAMFGKETYRHRLFESNRNLTAPDHPKHTVPASKAGHWKPGTFISVAGNCSPMWLARSVMSVDWMTRAELVESIPPYFSKHLAAQIMLQLTHEL